MATSRDMTVAQGGEDVKMHPYLVALLRWCVSYVWSTATVIIHRLMSAPLPLPPIAASKPLKSRPAGKEHLDPEPKVECVVLHQPEVHNLDVIFVHGLYGSLGNTWRQGEWREKYKESPEKIELKRPTSKPSLQTCNKCTSHIIYNKEYKLMRSKEFEIGSNNNEKKDFNEFTNEFEIRSNINEEKDLNEFTNEFEIRSNINEEKDLNEFRNIDEKFFDNIKRIIPDEKSLIEEKFYNNTLLNHVEIVSNYETQARFVSELFINDCDNYCDSNNKTYDNVMFDQTELNVHKNENEIPIICKCKTELNETDLNETVVNEMDLNECICKVNEKKCEVGCGCVCDDCYSPCWPRDWLKVDYPDARIISINYTSDPHLWRPLWVKESKRLCLYERAEQMTRQLLGLGVGERPVIWVGHSKGGLFIKQIYCEAYRAHLETLKPEQTQQNMIEFTKDNEINNINNNNNVNNNNSIESNENNNMINENNNMEIDDDSFCNEKRFNDGINGNVNNGMKDERGEDNENISEVEKLVERQIVSSNTEEPIPSSVRAALWSRSAGFMFYSVPHRGSRLADIKTPLTARSVELLEITKDCSPLLTLQDRWLEATSSTSPLVRSLVETRRTLMSVLRFMIVSPDSADAGIGALCGVSVDHREICKPSSRNCLLYKELGHLIRAAINRCKCADKS